MSIVAGSQVTPGEVIAPEAEPRPLQLWIPVVAALAMVATLPGRTHGLGLITEPLLKDLQLDRVEYATINLWATLLGALFCLPCGWLLDRLGTGLVLAAVSLGLGAVVILMSRLRPGETAYTTVSLPGWLGGGLLLITPLFVLILLTRGLGQSALSVVSLALVGRAAGRKTGPVFGVYSFIVAIGFMGAFSLVKVVLEQWHADWRVLWSGIGIVVACFSVVGVLLVCVSPAPVPSAKAETMLVAIRSRTLGQALCSPAFWVFGMATSLYGAIAAGLSLFNQSVLEERHFDRSVFLSITAITPLVGLASNLFTGWLTTRISLEKLLSGAMLVLAAALSVFPWVSSLTEVYAYAVLMGIVGGMVTVLFFAIWSHTFGPAHLGKIQGAAQMLTVLASALGPLAVALSKQWYSSYVPLFRLFAVVSAALAVVAWFTNVTGNTSRACRTRHSGP
jgi:MFS family permease